jgi:hypothetical protein
MNVNLVLRAVGLFYLTEEIVDMSPFDERFKSLYDMECELYKILLTLNDTETAAYQQLIEYRGALVQDF